MTDESLRLHLPHGLSDLFYEAAASKDEIERAAERVFKLWGYTRIILPVYGYYESVATGASTELRRKMYRFFDRDGQELALRPDITVPAARVVGTRLYDQPLPLRFFYVGSVFRNVEPQAGVRREFTQAGIELIGASSIEADAEVVALAASALEALGISRFQINLGQVAFLRGILSDTYLTGDELSELEQAISRKNDAELDRKVSELGIQGSIARAVSALPSLAGGPEILDTAMRLATNDAAQLAIRHLRQVYTLLESQGVADHVILDLGEVRSMAYYTGITFHAYVEGLGFHVCRGGRYDRLVRNFGKDLPAVGFALGTERIMLATEPHVDLSPDVLIGGEQRNSSAMHAFARQCRGLGLVVEMDVMPRSPVEVHAYADARQAKRTIVASKEGGVQLTDANGTVTMSASELEEAAASWAH